MTSEIFTSSQPNLVSPSQHNNKHQLNQSIENELKNKTNKLQKDKARCSLA